MAGYIHPQSGRNDRALSYYERRQSRASRRSPLSSLSPASNLHGSPSRYAVDHTSSFDCRGSRRPQVTDHTQHDGIFGAQSLQPLTWPPKGFDLRSKLSFNEAEAIVSKGAPSFKGFAFQTLNVPFRHSRFYAFAGMIDGNESLESSSKLSPLTEGMSFALEGAYESLMPWESLEQPSMTMCFGASPGTITLNHWVGLVARHLPSSETDSAVCFRPMSLKMVLDRLKFLEYGLDADPEAMESFLYLHLVHDPDMDMPGENNLGRQIDVLVAVLDTTYWIDFSDLRSQVIAAYYDNEDLEVAHLFFHQLLLSIELLLRIDLTNFAEVEKHRFLSLLPNRVAWSVTLAKLWLSNVTITQVKHAQFEDSLGSAPSVQVKAYNKLARIKQLEQLGWALKWPNMAQVYDLLEKEAKGGRALETSSAEAKTFFSGVILPGTSSSWFAMKCLIDCDTIDGHKLSGLNCMHPQSGFQYRNATYWYWSSIVGKVLGAAKGVNQDAGWIGPCLYTPDLVRYRAKLERVRCVIANPDPVPTRLTKRKIKNMAIRSDPLGPPDEIIPVDEFQVVSPKYQVVDTIRIEKLACPLGRNAKNISSDEPSVFNVAIKFAIEGVTYALRLRHDTSYIKAIPCQGPHVLFWDYAYKSIRVDCLLDQSSWGGVDATLPFTATAFDPIGEPGSSNPRVEHDVYDDEAVLVVEAFGVPDNEVFARAWCAYMGLSAIVANIDATCIACAIREAYAASVTVVILVAGRKDEDVEAIERSPPPPRKGRSRMPIK